MLLAIVENTAITHHGQIGVALHEAGARITQYRAWRDNLLPDPDSFDALVVFGGEQSALSDNTHPYLDALAQLMRETAEAGKAVLGVCLGAQVFARGLGAQNHLGTAREFGWHDVALTKAGRSDPVLSALPPEFPIFEWHSDTFTLPPNATHLAQTASAPAQAFRYGRAGYGMQFHFEASRTVVADWARIFPTLIEGLHPGWTASLPERAAVSGVQADAHGLAIARAWVAMVQT